MAETQADVAGAGGGPAQSRELRARGRKTMRRLLDAAITVFEKRGYHAARVDDIVKAARTSHGTFYLYFANKDDLFRALATDVATAMTDLAGDLGTVDRSQAGYDALRAWLDRFDELYDHYGAVIRAWTDAGTDVGEFGRLGTEVLGGFARVLADQIRASGVDHVDPDMAALALVAMIERFHYFVMAGGLRLDRDTRLDTLASITHVGVFEGTPRPLG